jgi:inhibitor of KinA sporulation pathway (predicted exonuclease)
MPEFIHWFKTTIFRQIKNIIKQDIDNILLDTYLQYTKSNTSRNFYQEIPQEYIDHHINKVLKTLHNKLTDLAKTESDFYVDSRKCPKHLRPTTTYNPESYKNTPYINKSLLDTSKQRDFFQIFHEFKSPYKLVFLDLETDGLTQSANILQISTLELETRDDPFNRFLIKDMCTSYIKPYDGYKIDLNNPATDIHKIEQTNIDTAPIFNEIAAEIIDRTVLCTIVGFNIHKFDIPILTKHLEKAGEKPSWTHTIDLAQAYWKHYPSSLTNALQTLGIIFPHKAHDAKSDALACINILASFITDKKLPDSPSTLVNLWKKPYKNNNRHGNKIVNICEPDHPWISYDWPNLYNDPYTTSDSSQATAVENVDAIVRKRPLEDYNISYTKKPKTMSST